MKTKIVAAPDSDAERQKRMRDSRWHDDPNYSDADLDKVFHPSKPMGMTKRGVITDIEQAANDFGDPVPRGIGKADNVNPWAKMVPSDPALLTDAIMQKYVDGYDDLCNRVVEDEISHDGMEEELSNLLFKVARKIKGRTK